MVSVTVVDYLIPRCHPAFRLMSQARPDVAFQHSIFPETSGPFTSDQRTAGKFAIGHQEARANESSICAKSHPLGCRRMGATAMDHQTRTSSALPSRRSEEDGRTVWKNPPVKFREWIYAAQLCNECFEAFGPTFYWDRAPILFVRSDVYMHFDAQSHSLNPRAILSPFFAPTALVIVTHSEVWVWASEGAHRALRRYFHRWVLARPGTILAR